MDSSARNAAGSQGVDALERRVERDASPYGALSDGLSSARPTRQKDITAWRRHQLIVATLLCMAEKGIHRTTIEEITTRAEVSRGLVRHHFRNKRDLLIHACRFLCDDFRIYIERHEDEYQRDPWRALDYLVRTIFETRNFNEVTLSAWFSFWIASRTDKDLQAVYLEFYGWYRAYSRNLFQRADDRGQLRANVDHVADAFVSMTDGLWLELSIDPTSRSPEYAASVCRTFLETVSVNRSNEVHRDSRIGSFADEKGGPKR